MRERLDCAIISTRCHTDWGSAWLGAHAGGRLHVHALDNNIDIDHPMSVHALENAAMQLQRFDACLLAVSPKNLGWVRTALSTAQGKLRTPILASVSGLGAVAINDLYGLGLADFIRDPVCTEELRVRIERLLDTRRYNVASAVSGHTVVGEASTAYPSSAGPAVTPSEQAFCDTILNRSGTELEAFAVASASRCATTRESFKLAKSQVIERFERAYITAALGRHSGNIAMAARAAQKHRRAFWALMRKHDIEAAPFRRDPSPNCPRDG